MENGKVLPSFSFTQFRKETFYRRSSDPSIARIRSKSYLRVKNAEFVQILFETRQTTRLIN